MLSTVEGNVLPEPGTTGGGAERVGGGGIQSTRKFTVVM